MTYWSNNLSLDINGGSNVRVKILGVSTGVEHEIFYNITSVWKCKVFMDGSEITNLKQLVHCR